VHRKANMFCPVNFRWWGSGERAGGPLDQVDYDRMCRAAGTDRRDGFLSAYAHTRCAPRPARVGGGADPAVGVDGMIVAASTTLLTDSRSGSRGRVLPWALLVVGSVASLAANVAVAEPSAIGRVIAAWPSFALIGAYELLMRQVRVTAAGRPGAPERLSQPWLAGPARSVSAGPAPGGLAAPGRRPGPGPGNGRTVNWGLRQDAWQWAEANRAGDGSLPSGRQIARQYGRHERWGRLVKRSGLAGEFTIAERTRENACMP
jgi:hypothetical protein